MCRPDLEAVGVEMVESVIPYEEAKIRILNASHSCIAWAGTLMGKQFIHESTLTDAIYAIADRYVTEDVIPRLGDNNIDLPTYRDIVLKRFTNPYIEDTNQRVTADGFSKISAMITATMSACYHAWCDPARNRNAACTVLCLHGAMAITRGNCLTNIKMAFWMQTRFTLCLTQKTRLRFLPTTRPCSES